MLLDLRIYHHDTRSARRQWVIPMTLSSSKVLLFASLAYDETDMHLLSGEVHPAKDGQIACDLSVFHFVPGDHFDPGRLVVMMLVYFHN